jgi:two-component system, NarL family, response regulator DegU
MENDPMMLYTDEVKNNQKAESNERVMVWVPKTRVVLADDHDIVRKGIRNLLRKSSDIIVVGEANNGNDAIRLVNQLQPDVLLLDIEMPGMNGVDVVRRLDEAGLNVNILVLSAYDDQEYILEMLGSGASGYLLKEETPEYILDAVHGVASGQKGWVSGQVAKKLEKIQQARRQEATLTFREIDIMRLLAAGKTDPEIAERLGMDSKTLGQMIQFLITKMSVKTREEALLLAKTQGWL